MSEQKLFSELIRRGVLSREKAERLLSEATLSGGSAEEALYEKNLADEEVVGKVKSDILSIPLKRIEAAKISDEALELVPKETAEHYKLIPIEKIGNTLTVGMFRPDDTEAQEALKFIARQRHLTLGIYLALFSDLRSALRRYAPFRSEIDAAVREIGAREDDSGRVSLEAGMEKSGEAPVIKIMASILKRAVSSGASDIHIEPQRASLRVRFRIDGDLEEAISMPRVLIQPVSSRVKVLANLKLDETRIPQDGRFRASIEGRDVDFRVATFPTPSGEKVEIRVLDSTAGAKDFSGLGLTGYNLKILNDAIERPYGMILITGPTGSGKTTTLYAVLQKVNTEKVNVVSLEDPVEYFIEGVNQSQMRPEIGYTFASGLRQILRQDPDVIMVGEVRDSETAGLAVNAALTGHIVLTTLHTNNSVGVVPRLIDLGVPSFLLSSALNLMAAQRLVGRICDNCKVEEKAGPEAEKIIRESIDRLPLSIKEETAARFNPPYKIFRAEPKAACEKCKGKGRTGRVALFEMFKMTRELGEIISAGFTEAKLLGEARRQGMVTLREDGILKVLEGIALFGEVLRETGEAG